MANLYELVQAIATYEMQFDEDGVWVNEQELEELNLARDEKVENILLWVKNLKAEAKAIREEEEALADRRGSMENQIDRLMDYVALGLNGEKFETPRVKVQWRNTEAVEILDEANVPEEFLKVEKTPKKTDIKQYLKAHKDENIEWATIRKRLSMSIR